MRRVNIVGFTHGPLPSWIIIADGARHCYRSPRLSYSATIMVGELVRLRLDNTRQSSYNRTT